MVLVNGWNYSLDPESIKASWDPLHLDMEFGIHIHVDEIYAQVSGWKYPLWKLNFSLHKAKSSNASHPLQASLKAL